MIASLLVLISLGVVFRYLTPSTDVWESPGTTHTDYSNWFTGDVNFRRSFTDTQTGWTSSEGPIKEGERHGRWLMSVYHEHSDQFDETEFWYWYGDRVSHGKFRELAD